MKLLLALFIITGISAGSQPSDKRKMAYYNGTILDFNLPDSTRISIPYGNQDIFYLPGYSVNLPDTPKIPTGIKVYADKKAERFYVNVRDQLVIADSMGIVAERDSSGWRIKDCSRALESIYQSYLKKTLHESKTH